MTDAERKERQKKLQGILERMRAVQDEFKGKPMPEAKAKEFDDLGAEAKAVQDELKREDALEASEAELKARREAEEKGAKVTDPITPHAGGEGEFKFERPVAYARAGDWLLAQPAFAKFREDGKPKIGAVLGRIPVGIKDMGRRGAGPVLVPLNLEQAKAFKAVPTIGSNVIEPTRVPELVRVTEHDRLTLRDVLDIQQTTSDAVRYTRITSYTRAAAAVANSASKPEATLSMDAVTVAVSTIAVWLPVEEQQLDDLPALGGLINGELLYDCAKHVEELVMYGSGEDEEFDGILEDATVAQCRTEAGDTLIDIARRGITDVMRAGYEPNAILVDPLDWETIVLEKGSDNRYVWVVVTDGATQRLWAVPVIETVAMTDFQGVDTEQRQLLVGDFLRGATLWDRMAAQVSVGWQNDQFVKNQRTILAELRAAFGVKRNAAFRKHQTQEASGS